MPETRTRPQADPVAVDLNTVRFGTTPMKRSELDLLVATNYVQELDARGTRNEKQYRVKSYMWFGAQRSNPKPQTESKNFLLSSQPKNFSPHVHDDVLKHEHQAEKTSYSTM